MKEFDEAIKDSSTPYKAPLGKDTIDNGPWAVFLPQPMSSPPGPAFAPSHLPLWLPEQQAIAHLPPYTQDPPVERGSIDSRVRHTVWMYQQGRFKGAPIGLTDPAEPLQSALDHKLPGLDPSEWPVMFVPVWNGSGVRSWSLGALPVVRT
ncbi:hypothetical protein [Anaeromyxobacter sp. SG64]|uniref:hypothetical protein n=1 Tax=Anaeromyxobacter sp. SG64 TaxID=2925409 RepID=UPI001F593818|nr:hypothetical protein [Anaeromyxobacter sp. SG64]